MTLTKELLLMNQKEFIVLISPFKDKLYRIAKRLLVADDEAQDATQEVLLKLWTNKEKLKKYNNVEAFAVTMTKNFCLDRLKSKQASNIALKPIHNFRTANDLEKQLIARDSTRHIKDLIDVLPEQTKLIVQLRDIEQYSFQEIAAMLNMKETAIRVTLSRARKKIKEQLIAKHNYGIN